MAIESGCGGKMKTLYITLLFFFGLSRANAVPVVIDSVGTGLNHFSTLYPDSKNPNLFYYAPFAYTIAKEDDRALFTYFESGYFWNRSAYVQMVFEAKFSELTLRKIAEVKQANPNAVFSPIPIMKSTIKVAPKITPLLRKVDCQNAGGVVEQQIGCGWEVKYSESTAFRRLLRDDAQVQVMTLVYEFIGIGQDGKEQIVSHSPVMRIGTKLTDRNFYDHDGLPIKD